MEGAKEFYSRNSHQQSDQDTNEEPNTDEDASCKVEKNQKTITDFFKKS